MGILTAATQKTVYFIESNTGLNKYYQAAIVSTAAPISLYHSAESYMEMGAIPALILTGVFAWNWNLPLVESLNNFANMETKSQTSNTLDGIFFRDVARNTARVTLAASVMTSQVCPALSPLFASISATNYILATEPTPPGMSLYARAKEKLEALLTKAEPVAQPA